MTIPDTNLLQLESLIKIYLDSDANVQWIFKNLLWDICFYTYQSFYQKFLFGYSSFCPKTRKQKIENIGCCQFHKRFWTSDQTNSRNVLALLVFEQKL